MWMRRNKNYIKLKYDLLDDIRYIHVINNLYRWLQNCIILSAFDKTSIYWRYKGRYLKKIKKRRWKKVYYICA